MAHTVLYSVVKYLITNLGLPIKNNIIKEIILYSSTTNRVLCLPSLSLNITERLKPITRKKGSASRRFDTLAGSYLLGLNIFIVVC